MLPKLFFISILLSSLISTHSYTQCLEHQRTLLLQLKNELLFNSSLSTKLVQWNQTNNDCCKWHGVECDAGGYVVSLQLDEESISGGIGDSSSPLFGLERLAKLNLAYNNFNYISIPRGIHSLTSLTHLNLSNAVFSGSVPPKISSLRRLVSLDLSNEDWISINLETILPNLTELRELYLDGVHIDKRTEWSHAISSCLPRLVTLSLRNCYLSGNLAESFWQLRSLSVLLLDYNDLSTVVPDSFASFSSLKTLTLAFCSLNGSFPNRVFNLPTLQNLDLSFNELLSGSIPPFTRKGSLKSIKMRTTNFSGSIPSSISNQRSLSTIAMSDSRFTGTIPSTLGNLTELVEVDLWGNFFSGSLSSVQFERLSNLVYLNLGGNLFTGNIPRSLFGLPSLEVLWLNDNQFQGRVEEFPFIVNVSSIVRLGLSSNQLEGPIPTSLCSAIRLDVLDLSVNKLSGSIPPCLHENVRVLHLARNNLTGRIPDNFPRPGCGLEYFDVSNNTLEGKIPKSLESCKSLKYVNVGNNAINDTFPCMLPSTLHVLVLRLNMFHGEVRCHKSWPDLRVLDISWNNFGGSLESMNFSSWTTMAMSRHDYFDYYMTGVTLIMKGQEMDLVKTHLDFGTIDFSCNDFSGEIPNSIGDLSLLHSLNLSHNKLNGSIPNAFGKLGALKSLDLSRNQLIGTIPAELLRLTFLRVLNLSNNKLVGEIPTDAHFQTFSADSFKGNPLLCGFNLNINCTSHTNEGDDDDLSRKNENEDGNEDEKGEIEWEYVTAPLGYVVGLGSFGWLLLLCPRFRHKYFYKIDEIVDEILDARDRRRRRARRS